MNELRNDMNLREAVSRREQQQLPLPADLNERLIERLTSSKENGSHPHFSSLSLWRGWGIRLTLLAVAASIALLIVFNFGQEQSTQEPLVAQQTIKQPTAQPAAAETVEEPVPVQEVAQKTKAQPSHKPKAQPRKEARVLVELIPSAETEPAPTDGSSEQDPLVAMAAQVEDIRSHGQRLQQEITALMDN
jgi:cytoskeletal protein RodZ